MAPSSITPRVFPFISQPAKVDLFFLTNDMTSSLSFILCTHCTPDAISLEERNRDAIANSFTAFACAPGVLKITMPFSLQISSGILFTPAPSLAITFKF